MLDGSSLALSGIGLVLATAAVALLERLYRCAFRAPPSSIPILRRCGRWAYDYTREKRLPLTAIAERKCGPGDAVDWFENHMLRAVPVSATSLRTGAVKALGSLTRARMYAAPSGIAKSAGGGAVYGDPMVSAKDFKIDLRWVRSVW